MATSSITKNFDIFGEKQAEMFSDAEAFANGRPDHVPVAARIFVTIFRQYLDKENSKFSACLKIAFPKMRVTICGRLKAYMLCPKGYHLWWIP